MGLVLGKEASMRHHPYLPADVRLIVNEPPSPVFHGPLAGIILRLRIRLRDRPVCHVLDQLRIVMLIGHKAVRKRIMHTSASFALQAFDNIPFLRTALQLVYPQAVIPVAQQTSTILTVMNFFADYQKFLFSWLRSTRYFDKIIMYLG